MGVASHIRKLYAFLATASFFPYLILTESDELLRACRKVEDAGVYLLDGLDEGSVFFPTRVFESPVFAMLAGECGALDIAAHGDDDVDGGDVFEQFATLGFLHVDAIGVFHEAYGILVNVRA